MDTDGLMRVFWPVDFARHEQSGVLVGWRNSALDIFVVTVISGINVCAPVVSFLCRHMGQDRKR